MKADRLMGILAVLLRHERVTAPYLAKKFEVSRRTVSRDIDALCRAGIPIVTIPGSGGGISIAEGYKMDKTLFTPSELKAIFAGLRGLDSISEKPPSEWIFSKFLTEGFSEDLTQVPFLIDLSSFYQDTLVPKISVIQTAVLECRAISFSYYYQKGRTSKTMEPYYLVYQWSSWYVWGYCGEKQDFRMYKLNRLWDLRMTEETFIRKEIPPEKLEFHRYFQDQIFATVLFEEDVEYRLVEEYGPESIKKINQNQLLFQWPFTNQDKLIEWVLSFGDQAELLEPKELRGLLRQKLEKNLARYLKQDTPLSCLPCYTGSRIEKEDDRMAESRCGILCGECAYREETHCMGCISIDKPFWGDRCPVKSCCEEKQLQHCGECPQFPCPLLNQFAYDEKQGDDGKRIQQCRIWLEQEAPPAST